MAPPRRTSSSEPNSSTRARDLSIVVAVFAAAATAHFRAHGWPEILAPSAGYGAGVPPGARVVSAASLFPPRRNDTDSLTKAPLDVLFVPGFTPPKVCHCGLGIDLRERCSAANCDIFEFEQKKKAAANCRALAARGECGSSGGDMFKECAEACADEPCEDLKEHCGFWQDLGECDINPGFMISQCPVACDVCDERRRPRERCLDRFPDWVAAPPDRLIDADRTLNRMINRTMRAYGERVAVLNLDPLVMRIEDFLNASEIAAAKAAASEHVQFRSTGTAAGPNPTKASSGWCMGTCRDQAITGVVSRRVADLADCDGENYTELLHYIVQKPGQQLGLKHDFTPEQTLTPAGPRIFSAEIFLDSAPSRTGGELWFPDLLLAVRPKAGRVVVFLDVKHDDFLSADPRTRHAHRPLLDHVPSEIRILEAWTHIFDFMTPHRHTCIAPHGAYAPADADDAAELRVRKADLLAKREALHETRGKWQSDDAFIDLVTAGVKRGLAPDDDAELSKDEPIRWRRSLSGAQNAYVDHVVGRAEHTGAVEFALRPPKPWTTADALPARRGELGPRPLHKVPLPPREDIPVVPPAPAIPAGPVHHGLPLLPKPEKDVPALETPEE
mmetsp:Transcript_36847/g.112741  ORF Transcript_36847/g.112741 Transcript_36847/m.112741 type:complete len:615 (-) Transcript_36847:45-1889(-)